MATRSRKGCIDCKQAKIKCDEVHPFCGTCARRRRQCRGYAAAGTPLTNSSASSAAARAAAATAAAAMSSGVARSAPHRGRQQVVPPYPAAPAGRRSPHLLMAPALALLPAPDSSSSEDGSSEYRTEDYRSPAAWASTPPGGAVGGDDGWAETASPSASNAGSPHYVYPHPYPSSQRLHRRQRTPPSSLSSSSSAQATTSTALVLSHTILEAAAARQGYLSPLRGPSFIPLNEILAEDKPIIEIYFMRHPTEMVMSNDFFINEMNGAVISLLQQSPSAVGESLCAIGENYLKDPAGTALVSNRKTRLLHRVMRLLNTDGSSPELVLLLLLALCGAELTDPGSDGKGETLSSLIENVALILEFHARSGRELNFAARYFAKGVARQDLLLSLSRMQRTRINPAIWLDEYAMTHADRLLGLTATMTPILARLSALAEDVQKWLESDMAVSLDDAGAPSVLGGTAVPPTSASSASAAMPPPPPLVSSSSAANPFLYSSGFTSSPEQDDLLAQIHRRRAELAARSDALRAQLESWQPIRDSNLSLETSRRLILHASAWKAAALLYLYRLFHRAGSSAEADQTAQGMAYEILVNISGPAEDIKLSLWPLFMASCELQQPEDRDTATQLFDDICRARPIMTAKRTKSFCTDQVWRARDRGELWDWMHLTKTGPNAFMPA